MLIPSCLVAALMGYEVHLVLQAPGTEAMEVTLVDVQEGPLPAFFLSSSAGAGYVFQLTLSPSSDDAVQVDADVRRLAGARRGGVRTDAVSRPVLRVKLNEPAEVLIGKKGGPDSAGSDALRLGVEVWPSPEQTRDHPADNPGVLVEPLGVPAPDAVEGRKNGVPVRSFVNRIRSDATEP